jgi:hypothetical protein
MNWLLTSVDSWLILTLGTVLILRQLLIITSAERGRKQDLVKRLYKANTDFHIAIVVPVVAPEQLPALRQLWQALNAQEYPTSRFTTHWVATRPAAAEIDHDSLGPTLRLWTHPDFRPHEGQLLEWGIERILAAGGSDLFVFLKPEDIVKPDYLQNVVSRAFEHAIMQGYVATRRRPQTPLAKVLALSGRLFNRIENAGRFHAGLSCRLLDSGWAVRREVLEMYPFQRGHEEANLEYTLLLEQHGVRIVWAPNVVVYRDAEPPLFGYVTARFPTLWNHLRLIVQYWPSAFIKGLFSVNGRLLDQAINLLTPPAFWLGALLLVMAALHEYTVLPIPGETWLWLTLFGAFFVLHLLAHIVARCRTEDYGTLAFWTPAVHLGGFALMPVSLLQLFFNAFSEQNRQARKKHGLVTRFNEDLEAPEDFLNPDEASYHRILDDMVAQRNREEAADEEAPVSAAPAVVRPAVARPVAMAAQKLAPQSRPLPFNLDEGEPRPTDNPMVRERVKMVPLTNGARQVDCVLRTRTTLTPEGHEVHQMTLEYKTHAFTTAPYRILDQAFYELQSKLAARGFSLVTCGSCGYFYSPTADVPGALKNNGYCLFGKQGKEVNLAADAVTVVSQACTYHAPTEERERILNEWQDSLSRR